MGRCLSGLLNNTAGDKSVHPVLLSNAMAIGQVNDRVHGQDSLDCRIDALKALLPIAVPGCQAGKQRQVPTRRTPRDNDEVRISPVFVNVLLNPGYRLFHINNLGGVCVSGGQAVINGDTDPSHLDHSVQ